MHCVLCSFFFVNHVVSAISLFFYFGFFSSSLLVSQPPLPCAEACPLRGENGGTGGPDQHLPGPRLRYLPHGLRTPVAPRSNIPHHQGSWEMAEYELSPWDPQISSNPQTSSRWLHDRMSTDRFCDFVAFRRNLPPPRITVVPLYEIGQLLPVAGVWHRREKGCGRPSSTSPLPPPSKFHDLS